MNKIVLFYLKEIFKMIKKKYVLASLGLSTFLLASCDGENIKEMQSSVNEIDQIHDDIITELNALTDEEAELQTSFDETLKSDEELSTFADGSAPVFENIESRREHLESIKSLDKQFEEQEENLASYEGESLSGEELDGLNSIIDEFSSQLQEFTKEYDASLTSQKDYFTSIAGEKATYDTFSEGISTVNEQQSAMQEDLVTLDETLVSLDTQITEAQEMIETAITENE